VTWAVPSLFTSVPVVDCTRFVKNLSKFVVLYQVASTQTRTGLEALGEARTPLTATPTVKGQ
jgi:hypothetical protein